MDHSAGHSSLDLIKVEQARRIEGKVKEQIIIPVYTLFKILSI